MNQDDNNDPPFGIKLDLSSSYPILKKGDGKPVEGDMEGICIYPNIIGSSRIDQIIWTMGHDT